MRPRVLVLVAILAICVVDVSSGDEPNIEQLWQRWQSGDREAYITLRQLGPETHSLAARLLETDELGNVRLPEGIEAYDAIQLLRAMESDALPVILSAMQDAREDELVPYFQYLATLGPMARPAAEMLILKSMESDEEIQIHALEALVEIGGQLDYVTPELTRILESRNPWQTPRSVGHAQGKDQNALRAATMLSRSADPRARTSLVSAFEHQRSPQVREQACRALASTFPDDPELVQLYIRSLDDDEATTLAFPGGSVARTIATILCNYDELPADAALPLIQKLYRQSFEDGSVDPLQLSEAICLCPTSDLQARELVTAKISPLIEADAYFHRDEGRVVVQVAAACVILHWNPTDTNSAEYLVQIAQGDERHLTLFGKGYADDLRADAVRGLGRLGHEGQEWLPVLRKILEHEYENNPGSNLEFETAWAIARIDPTDEACIDALREEGEQFLRYRQMTWEQVEQVLGHRTHKLVEDVPAEVRRISNPEYLLDNSYYEWHWMRLKPHADLVLEELNKHVNSEQLSVRFAAAEALGFLGSSSDESMALMSKLLNDPRAVIRLEMIRSLRQVKGLTPEVVQAVARAANDEYVSVALEAQQLLDDLQIELDFR